ncbi:MAG: 23S rRNA (adenine(2503)-C(2))-methyltransferase RlmN [Phycisphaerales bacterium]|nr:23S rRNA (adenine(2503)-C(2))-methyltransferase RlmN [Phycisphaerales bacterium]
MKAVLPSPFDVPAARYASVCEAARLPGGRAGALDRYQRLFREGVRAQPGLTVEVDPVTRTHESDSAEGRVVKFALALQPRPDKPGERLETESVVIPMIGKKRVLTHTLCVSSQVGCAMGCTFCQTAQMGLLRDLTTAEIVQQWFAARHLAPNPQAGTAGFDTIRNVVFMGMGEPMDNLAAVIDAVAVLTDHRGPCLPMSKVTISTVGRVDGIARLAAKVREPGWHRLNLAVSLNAPNDEIRATIMPINRKYPMRELHRALEEWPIYGAAKICFEYVLIPGINDREEHARQLGDFVVGRGEYEGRPPLPGLVNLIPYNPRDNSPWNAPTEDDADRFLRWLLDAGTYAKRRRTKGRDTMAACGQLGNPALRKPRRVQITVPASMP